MDWAHQVSRPRLVLIRRTILSKRMMRVHRSEASVPYRRVFGAINNLTSASSVTQQGVHDTMSASVEGTFSPPGRRFRDSYDGRTSSC